MDEKMIMTPIQLNTDRSFKFDGKVLPVVPVMCTNCGNTVLINPLVVDAVDKMDDDLEEEESGNSK
nr:MAG TPA: nucleic-acid-binding protein [Caudoviricetes sp.]